MKNDLSDKVIRSLEAELNHFGERRYTPRALAEKLNSPRSLLLVSIPKCGTTWMRFLLVNYARLLADPDSPPATGAEIDLHAPARNRAERGLDEWVEPPPFLPAHGYDYLLSQHIRGHRFQVDRLDDHAGRKICMIRNPLDYLVSSYFFYFAARAEERDKAGHPRDLIQSFTRSWALAFRHITEFVVPHSGGVLVRYEELAADSAAALARTLVALGVPADAALVGKAAAMSSPAAIRAQEEKGTFATSGALDSGRFVRDSSVGQWRKYFAPAEVESVRTILKRYGVPESELARIEAGAPA